MQCKYVTTAKKGYFCCVREHGHPGDHVDYLGGRFSGFLLPPQEHWRRDAPHIWFGSAAEEMLREFAPR